MVENKKEDSPIVDYHGVCPVCGSSDGMIVKGNDGKFRTMCRNLSCPLWMAPAPAVGFDSEGDCREPFETEYLQGDVTIHEYKTGKKLEEPEC